MRVLAILACLSLGGSAFSPVYVGINNGDHETDAFSLTDPKFQAAIAQQAYGTYRYPGGTAANYWDWKQGCQTGSPSCGKNNNTLAAFVEFVAATAVEPIFVLNMLTDTLTSQLQFLASAATLNLPITRVELGNEFFNNHADYVSAFPTGADYGRTASAWITAISAVYPNATFAAVGAPSVIGNDARKQAWNADMFKTLKGAAAVTMHEYHDSQIGTAPSFTEADVPIMLGAPFYWMAGIVATTSKLPAGYSVWMTEFNIKDTTASGVTGTWAHGLYMATHTVLAMNSSTRISLVDIFCSIKDAQLGSIFEDTASFNYALSPDTSLVTATYARSATGYATGLITAAALGRTAVAPISFPTNPSAQGATAKYLTLQGVVFGPDASGRPASGVAINLGPKVQNLPLAAFGTAANYTTLTAVAGTATAAINDASKLVFARGTAAGNVLSLPPYSISAFDMQ